ncbi:hypothetical protein GRF56_08890 [Aeromonas veronii]|uniref:hypothetical protein n=1 Tax=Aeromonas veronii TaxID=654 RepID=UPI0013184924|nr:hypothetical protein [Aeromonas veronii]QHC07525.1 hypothetical protein GRF56_08890 [Aeromonas veronii]
MKVTYNKDSVSLCLMIISVIYLSGLDIVGLDIGNITIKPQLLCFPMLLCLSLIKKKFFINAAWLMVSLVFIVSLLPSLFFSLNPLVSSGFLFGAFSCVCAMLFCAELTRELKVNELLCSLMIAYRISIVITLFLVAFGLQQRGHFILYESSYWAIFLIPYSAIFFFRLLNGSHCNKVLDCALLSLALLLSQSASFVIWCFFVVIALMFYMGKLNCKHFILFMVLTIIGVVLLINFNQRANYIYSEMLKINTVEGVFNVLIFLAGNRIQRVLVPYYVGIENPFFGVGAGLLRDVAPLLNPDEFKIYGISAVDFNLNSSAPGVNILLEIFSEYGTVGVIGFLGLTFYVLRNTRKNGDLLPLRVALIVTLLALMIESNFMRYYLWVLMGFILGMHRPTLISKGLIK